MNTPEADIEIDDALVAALLAEQHPDLAGLPVRLVAHGWDPGEGRMPAPGSQEAAGQLVQAWIDSGAECPP